MAKMSEHKSISRIDQHHKKNHGWYVRVTWKGQNTSKFFNDTKCGGKAEALQEAIDFRNEVEEALGKPRSERQLFAKHRLSNIGTRGIRRITASRKRGDIIYYWDVFQVTMHPVPGVTKRQEFSICRAVTNSPQNC